jgi:hypothetical protein
VEVASKWGGGGTLNTCQSLYPSLSFSLSLGIGKVGIFFLYPFLGEEFNYIVGCEIFPMEEFSLLLCGGEGGGENKERGRALSKSSPFPHSG